MEFSYFIKKINRKLGVSTRLIIIISLHILIIGLNGWITYYATSMLKMDARIINESGIIRGTIQKITKLELNHIEAKDDIEKVDFLIDDFLIKERGNIEDSKLNAFLRQLEKLKKEWLILKELIFEFRSSQDLGVNKKLIEQSEKCWDVADQTVYIAQALSETKLSTFQILFIVFFLDFILIVAIIWLINSVVRHNLEQHARVDSLTGVYNRHVFNEELLIELERSQRYGHSLSLILFDIDHFKKVNDTYGHDEGDRVLRLLSHTIKSLIRKNDIFCRTGGEEFAIITVETNSNEAFKFAEKLRGSIENTNFGKVERVTISMGITSWKHSDSSDTLYKRADEALYNSKESGRNIVSMSN